MAKKSHVSETLATAWLRAHGVVFTEHPHDYVDTSVWGVWTRQLREATLWTFP